MMDDRSYHSIHVKGRWLVMATMIIEVNTSAVNACVGSGTNTRNSRDICHC